jgi:hypothetical protein
MSGLHLAGNDSYNDLKTAGFLRLTLITFWPERGDSNFRNPTCHTFDTKLGL